MRNKLKRMKNQFWDFYFLSYCRFCTQNWSTINQFWVQKRPLSRKLKIGKCIFHSSRHILYLSCKYEPFWKKKLKHLIHSANFFLCRGFHPPHPPPRLCPWTPHAFGLNPQPYWLASESGSQFTVNHCWIQNRW